MIIVLPARNAGHWLNRWVVALCLLALWCATAAVGAQSPGAWLTDHGTHPRASLPGALSDTAEMALANSSAGSPIIRRAWLRTMGWNDGIPGSPGSAALLAQNATPGLTLPHSRNVARCC